MDLSTQANLEDFIKMKQKKETQHLTAKQRKSNQPRRLNTESTVNICTDLTKWMKDNEEDFVVDTKI